MPTVDDVKNYLGIDYADTMVTANITRAIAAADAYLVGALGEGYPQNDERVLQVALMVIADLYDVRGIHDTLSGNVRKLFNDMTLQVRLEMRRTEGVTE